jgi:hypothetical protein
MCVQTGCREAPPAEVAHQYISNWSATCSRLPKEEVDFFKDHFELTGGQVCEALSHDDSSVRVRAAYVLGEIGPRARSVEPVLRTRLENEPSQLVRMYLVTALGQIGASEPATLRQLVARYEELSSENVPVEEDYSYAEVDERIGIAATLYLLTNQRSKRDEYLHFVTQWLAPLPRI